MDDLLVFLGVALAALVVWGLTERWRQERHWRRHRERQRGNPDDH